MFAKSLSEVDVNFKLIDKCDIDKYLGVEITKHKDRLYELIQLYLIQMIVK